MKADFIFLVHPRSISDIYRKYPAFKYLPERLIEATMYFWPSVEVAPIRGMKSVVDGREIKGLVVTVSLTPSMMIAAPALLKRKVLKVVRKAEKAGVKLIGLGGWLPSFTEYGLNLKGSVKNTGITTGHAYAALTIAYYVEQAIEQQKGQVTDLLIAIVGAGGSTGSLSLETLIDRKIGSRFLLIDLPKKIEKLTALASRFEGSHFIISSDLYSLQDADIVVVVTNAGDCILRPEHIKDGAVIIDDTQPRNTSQAVHDKATVIEVLSCVPGLKCNFDFGLNSPDVTFTCLAETAILAANNKYQDFSIGRPDISKVIEISRMAKVCGANPAPHNEL